MNKYVLSFLFLLVAASVLGQSKSKVDLISSSSMEAPTVTNGKRIIKVHNGIFKQDNSTLRSDSALFYPDLNMIDAFGHVNINQSDTLNIYSDKLNYNGNTKVAILTNNVKMIDKDAILTTNYFTYNTATRIGTYTGGGKLVNKDNTLVSKNGYYFAFTRDEYFRYNVVCTTTDAVIKTDTLRYNSGSRITYFYGPTHILGKDKDDLYTENGTYNTVTEQAAFGKNNLYTQQTKTLKGDSLFYDRLKGYGRAVKNVVFNDNEQRTTLKGDLGEYYKADDRAVVTQNAYMIFVTEDSTAVAAPDKKLTADSLLKNKKIISTGKDIKKAAAINKAKPGDKKLTLQAVTDSVTTKLPANTKLPIAATKNLTLKGVTDSVTKAVSRQTNIKGLPDKKMLLKNIPGAKLTADTIAGLNKTPRNVRYDSLFFVADTLKTQILTFKDFKILKAKQYEASHRDTSIKIIKRAPPVVYKKAPKFLSLDAPKWQQDILFTHSDFFGKPKVQDKAPEKKLPPKIVKVVVAPKKTAQDSIRDKRKADSLALHGPKGLSDTSRIRIVQGYYHAKLFKSDLQAKADSMFYSSSDSTIRMYVNPMIWTQGSQLSGDTVNLQMKNQKLDNLDMYPAAFIVNIEKNDSTHFNQAGGKKMHGTFKNDKLRTFAIIGNAETIYFKRDTVKNIVTDMSRTFSSRAYATFENGEIISNAFVEKYEARAFPISKVKEEDKILKNFIWKPKDRPLSKESILSGYYKKPVKAKTVVKAPPNAKGKGKLVLQKPGSIKLSKDTVNRPATVKSIKDTVAKHAPATKAGKDSVVKDTTPIRRSIIIK